MLYDSSEAGASEERKCKREDELSCNEIARESISYSKTHNPDVLIRFETTVPDSLYILTNRVYLTRTLRELLYNATLHSDKKHIMMRVVHTSTHILFMVQDTGPGLPQDAQHLIDKPFAKVDMLSQGLGLGLPLCKRHAMTLGGELTLDPNYHDGCRFILQLPR
jgi:signal transduction histidine kinase